ncbi:MAG: sec-independent protein translocase protein TatB [Sulfurimonas sp.]|jgi:sec-independent protein translocase protein TatB
MFGMGFTEILIIAVIAILFLGPDNLPSAMIEVAKFFRSIKKTVSTVKNSLEEEMNVADIKKEALAYKKELLDVTNDLKKATDVSQIGNSIGTSFKDLNDDILSEEKKPKVQNKLDVSEEITFEKKDIITKIDTTTKKEKEENKDV